MRCIRLGAIWLDRVGAALQKTGVDLSIIFSASQLGLDAVAALEQIRSKIGQPRLCSLKAVERKVNARLRESKAAGFMAVTVYTTPTGQITLHWRRNQEALAERCEGRSLLVTNDRSLSHHEMFRLYRQKDGQALRSIVPTARDTHTPPHRGGCSNDTGCPQLRSRRR